MHRNQNTAGKKTMIYIFLLNKSVMISQTVWNGAPQLCFSDGDGEAVGLEHHLSPVQAAQGWLQPPPHKQQLVIILQLQLYFSFSKIRRIQWKVLFLKINFYLTKFVQHRSKCYVGRSSSNLQYVKNFMFAYTYIVYIRS